MTDIQGALARLRALADEPSRYKYDIGDYWNAAQEAVETIEDLQRKYNDLRARLEQAEAAMEKADEILSRPDFLAAALNSGDGTYRP